MKRISFVELEKFKCFKERRRFDFTAGLNIITGETARGKSTMFKGILKCLFNFPDDRAAEKNVTWGIKGKNAYAEIRVGIFDEDTGQTTVIERLVGKTVNAYNIYYEGQESTPSNYEKFGKAVPAEVTAVHGMRGVDMGYEKNVILNYIAQYDKFFLTTLSPEQAATAVGRIARTQVTDNVRAGLRSDIVVNTRETNASGIRLSDKKKELEQYEYLEGKRDRLDMANRKMEELSAFQDGIAGIETFELKASRDASGYRTSHNRLKIVDYLKIERLLDMAEHEMTGIQEISNIVDRTYAASMDYRRASIQLARYIGCNTTDGVKKLDEAESVLASTNVPIVEFNQALRTYVDSHARLERFKGYRDPSRQLDECEQLLEVVSNLSAVVRTGDMAIRNYSNSNTMVNGTKASLDIINEKVDKLRAELGDLCPVCGSDIKDKDIDELLAHA